jgi:phage recombination protein Bet
VKKLAQTYGVEDAKFYNMIVSTVFPSKLGKENKAFAPTQEMVMAFLVVCDQYDLNPIMREIYPFIDSNGNLRVIVGIDGWIKHVQRHPDYDGHEFFDHIDQNTQKVFATSCKIWRKGRSRPTEMVEYMVECKRPTEPWEKWPTRMLKHKAFIQCARYAFGMAGVEDEDDFERSITIQPASVEAPRRLSETRSSNVTPAPSTQTSDSAPSSEKAKQEEETQADALLDEDQVKNLWKLGMNGGLAKVDINKLLKDHFGVDKVQSLRQSQYEAAIEKLIGSK